MDNLQAFNQTIIEEFRSNAGKVGKVGGPVEGAPLLLLTTTGAKSGVTRINPVAYFTDADRYIIVASYEGAPTNPPWYYNLLANPDVGVEVGSERFDATAQVVPEPERTKLFQRMTEVMAVFTEYQQRTSRVIPVVALSRT
jgi:deazaflavin-dependent oxidoreductase (nitroreductase family)